MDYSFGAHGQPGLTLGAGVRYVGASYGDETNTLRVPAYTLLDAMARYEFSSAWTLTLNAKNLENKQYAAACAYGTCWQGIGRTVQATLRYRW
jgi:iron complex outermembrane receptor protein